MNRFTEFDYIKTPENWIDDALSNNYAANNKNKVIRIKYLLVSAGIIMAIGISSLGITYAFFEPFRTWLDQQFAGKMKISSSLQFNTIDAPVIELDDKRWSVENGFVGIVDENYYYKKVYVVENDQLVECKINEYQGTIDHETYAFKYVIYQDRIIGFDYRGCVYGILPRVVNDEIYVTVEIKNKEKCKLNLARIELQSGEANYITDDNISVNPIASLQQTNILINKSDQIWQNYNVSTKQTNIVKNIDPYQHSNCITFIDEQTVVTYGSNGNPILLNILTDEFEELSSYPLEGTMVNLTYLDDTIKLTNIVTNATAKLKYHFNGSNYLSTACSKDFIVLFDNDKIYIYDINNNRLTELNSKKELDEKLNDVMIVDQSHLLIITDKSAYIVANDLKGG